MNPEMLKLVIIIGVGLPLGIIGQIIIIKRKNAKKAHQAQMYSQEYKQSESSQNMSKEEETARNYIEQYKSQYPQESIKQGLLNYGISAEAADDYIKKYF